MAYDVATVRLAVRSLRERGLLRTVHRTGERSDKHQHLLEPALGLSPAQVALLAVLLLRGPQTAAELRARTERMHPFGSADEVEAELDALAGRDEPLAVRLERQPGRKEARYAQAVVEGAPAPAVAVAGATAAPDAVVAPRPAPAASGPPPAASGLAELRAEVDALRAELAELRAEVEELRGR